MFGRHAAENVVVMERNSWSSCNGKHGRHGAEFIKEGEEVTFDIVDGEKGPQAANVMRSEK